MPRVSIWRSAVVSALITLIACVEVPKESVELSVTIGRDLGDVHRANRELATRYFDRIKDDVNRFGDEA